MLKKGTCSGHPPPLPTPEEVGGCGKNLSEVASSRVSEKGKGFKSTDLREQSGMSERGTLNTGREMGTASALRTQVPHSGGGVVSDAQKVRTMPPKLPGMLRLKFF